MMCGSVMFGVIVSHVEFSSFPGEDEVPLPDFVLNPHVSHVHGTRSLFLDCV